MADQPCEHCGHCPTCGRSGTPVVTGPQWRVPYRMTPNSGENWPYDSYYAPTTTTTTGNTFSGWSVVVNKPTDGRADTGSDTGTSV